MYWCLVKDHRVIAVYDSKTYAISDTFGSMDGYSTIQLDRTSPDADNVVFPKTFFILYVRYSYIPHNSSVQFLRKVVVTVSDSLTELTDQIDIIFDKLGPTPSNFAPIFSVDIIELTE